MQYGSSHKFNGSTKQVGFMPASWLAISLIDNRTPEYRQGSAETIV